MPAAIKISAGDKFYKLTALEPAVSAVPGRHWRFKCDCGGEIVARASQVRSGYCMSCGCLANIKGFAHPARLPGRSDENGRQTTEYNSWCAMRARCTNPNQRNYRWYGGRGIAICARWMDSFDNFLADMGPKPSRDYTLERIDVDGDYEPANCKWLLWSEQKLNKKYGNRYKTGLAYSGKSP